MALQHHIMSLPYLLPSPPKHSKFIVPISLNPPISPPVSLSVIRTKREVTRLYAFKTVDKIGLNEGNGDSDDEDEPASSGDQNDPQLMDPEERRDWRNKIRQVLDRNPDFGVENLDPTERANKVQQLLADYPLVVDEEDPEWPEDSDGRGFKLDQFFDKITIKNKPNKDNNDDDDDSDDDEVVWQDDNYIRPIKDVTTAEWEETVFKDISPLIILVHNRYNRPKENEKIRAELEKAVNIIWNCRLPSPRCVAIDAVTELDLVSALQVSVFPQMIFTQAGKILYREKAIRNGDELSKIMAFFYYGAVKPTCLNDIGDRQEEIPSVPINSQP